MEQKEKKDFSITQVEAVQSSDFEEQMAVETSEWERYQMENDSDEDTDDEDYDDNYSDSYDYDDEPGWGSYDEYGGYNGYDDFTIDSAFDGDPESTWNID